MNEEERGDDRSELEEDFDDELIDEMSQAHLIQEPKKTLK